MPEGKVITSVVWSAQNLPNGLVIGESTGIISGTPTSPGQHLVALTVTTNYGTDTKNITIIVVAPDSWKPSISSDQSLTLVAGEEMTPYSVLGTNITLTQVAPTFSASRIRATYGMTLEEASITVSAPTGTNLDGGVYTLELASEPETTLESVPTWVSIDSQTGVISADVPAEYLDSLTTLGLKRIVTTSGGTASQTVVVEPDGAPWFDEDSISLTAPLWADSYSVGAPTGVNLSGATFSLTPLYAGNDLPDWLTLDTTTGAMTLADGQHTPSTAGMNYEFYRVATNDYGTTWQLMNILLQAGA